MTQAPPPVPSTQLPVRAPALLYSLASVYVTPEKNSEQMEQALKEREDEHEKQLRLDLQRGLGPFENLPVEERRALFMQQTDLADLRNLVRDPDILIEAAKNGQIVFRSPYWAMVFRARDTIKRYFLRQFQDALKDALERVAEMQRDANPR